MSLLQGHLYKLFNFACRLSSKQARIAAIENKLNIKPKPKRPATTFFKYTSRIKPELIKKHPDASPTELVKLAAVEWKKADSNLKTELQEEFKMEWDHYREECRKYESQLSPGARQQLEQVAKEVQTTKDKKLLKKKQEELGKPKKPPSTFVMFLLSKAAERGDMPFRDWQIKVGKEWEMLPESEKSKLSDMHKKELDAYRKRLADWEKKMMAEGNHDVVAISPLRETTEERLKENSSDVATPPSKLEVPCPLSGAELECPGPSHSVYELERRHLLKNISVYRRVTIVVTAFGLFSLLACFLIVFALIV